MMSMYCYKVVCVYSDQRVFTVMSMGSYKVVCASSEDSV